MAPKQTDPQFKLRMTPKIKGAIEEAAEENNRSMNAEILARLEQSFDPLIINVRNTGDIYGELTKIVDRTIRTVRAEEIESADDLTDREINELYKQNDPDTADKFLGAIIMHLHNYRMRREAQTPKDVGEYVLDLFHEYDQPLEKPEARSLTPELFDKLFARLSSIDDKLAQARTIILTDDDEKRPGGGGVVVGGGG